MQHIPTCKYKFTNVLKSESKNLSGNHMNLQLDKTNFLFSAVNSVNKTEVYIQETFSGLTEGEKNI